MLLMWIWLVVCQAVVTYQGYLFYKGTRITWRECRFFVFGLFVSGMPLIYVMDILLKSR